MLWLEYCPPIVAPRKCMLSILRRVMDIIIIAPQRINHEGQSRKAYNLIWNFKDLIDPQVCANKLCHL